MDEPNIYQAAADYLYHKAQFFQYVRSSKQKTSEAALVQQKAGSLEIIFAADAQLTGKVHEFESILQDRISRCSPEDYGKNYVLAAKYLTLEVQLVQIPLSPGETYEDSKAAEKLRDEMDEPWNAACATDESFKREWKHIGDWFGEKLRNKKE